MTRLHTLTLGVGCLLSIGASALAPLSVPSNAGTSPRDTPQVVSGETVSREVMALLMRAPGTTGGNFDLRVGPPPESFPVVLLPPGTVPEVTAVGVGDVTVIGRHPSLDVSGLFEQLPRVTAAGWTAQVPLMRGFVGAPAGSPLSVCRERDFAAISFVPREAGGIYVRVTVRSDPRQSCVPRPNPMFADVNVPMLTPPAGARPVGGGGGGGGADEMYSRSRLESAMTPRVAAAHYVRQF